MDVMRAVVVLVAIVLLGLPFSTFAAPGNGNGGGGGRGGAPLPVIGVGLPGVAAAGAAFLFYRKKRGSK
jgi:hypothetical protein